MARRTRSRRAENAGDFAGPDANKEAIETLSKAAAKENAKAKKNTGEVTDETVGMHVNLIKAAEANWREARDRAAELQGVLRNRFKVAKNDGVDVDALKLAFKINERASGEIVAEQRNVGRYLKIMGSPLGTQWSLFEDSVTDDGKPKVDASLQGQHAGRNGEPAENNPFTPGTDDFAAWAEGWTNGQAMLAGGIGKGGSGASAH